MKQVSHRPTYIMGGGGVGGLRDHCNPLVSVLDTDSKHMSMHSLAPFWLKQNLKLKVSLAIKNVAHFF